MSGWGTDNRLGGDFGRWEVFVVIAEEEEGGGGRGERGRKRTWRR